MKVNVEILKDWALWKKGDRMSFDSVLASSIIHRGIARQYKTRKKKAK